jgi:hypothetical protein
MRLVISLIDFCQFDWSLFNNVITSISTFGLFFLAIISGYYLKNQITLAQRQLKESVKVTKLNLLATNTDFLLRLKNDFFTKETRDLFLLIDNNLLIYKNIIDTENEIDFHYFEIDFKKIEIISWLKDYYTKNDKTFYSSSDIEDLLLNHFEDLGIFKDKGLLSGDLIYDSFSYYIVVSYENSAISDYLINIRKKDLTLYSKFKSIYDDIKEKENK